MKPSIDKIKEVVAKTFEVDDINKRDRRELPSLARHVFIYYCRQIHKLRVEEIAKIINRHHSLVSYAYSRIMHQRRYDAFLQQKLEGIESEIC